MGHLGKDHKENRPSVIWMGHLGKDQIEQYHLIWMQAFRER